MSESPEAHRDSRSLTKRRDRKLAWAVFALLFVSYAYFYQSGGWNENSRMDLVRALVHERSIAIDNYHTNTGDKAMLGGHYYSDKAPGLSIAAIPAYLLTLLVRPVVGGEHDFVVLATYLVTLLTVGLSGALVGWLLFRVSRKLGASPMGSVIAAVGYGLGTAAFPFSTMLFGHQLTALLLFSAFCLAWRCRDHYSDRDSILAGLLCAGATLTEFPAAPVVLILAAYHGQKHLRTRRLATFFAGALGPALLLSVYLAIAFGSPFRVGYDFLADPASRAEMQLHGIFGVTHPRVAIVVELLIGRYRGLFPYSPVLIFAAVGFGIAWYRGRSRAAHGDPEPSQLREIVTAGSIVVYFLLFVSSYTWWQGGSSFGSRHIIPMLPFLAMPLGLAADLRPKLTLAALTASVAIMMVVTAVQPKPSERARSPFFGTLLPAFSRSRLSANNVCPLVGVPRGRHVSFIAGRPTDAFNLGMVLGGRGHRTLIPLYSLWFAAAWAFWRTTRKPREEEPADPENPDHDRDRTEGTGDPQQDADVGRA